MFSLRRLVSTGLLLGVAAAALAQPARHEHFKTSVYTRYYEVAQMANRQWLANNFAVIDNQVHVDKIYLETHRDRQLVDAQTLEQAIAFFRDKGIEVAGGITLTISEPNRFQTFCYSDPDDRAWVKQVVEFTARHFDELILDDFFFTSCKDAGEIAAKRDRSWTDYRLALMRDAAIELVIGPAKAVNPDVKVVIKYPNWYEHFQGLGFNLESEPVAFDGIYTGTETRDAVLGELGEPVGVKSYRPYHATGEDFLHNYLGMIGIPIDLYPDFPADAHTVLLTESAAFDDAIVDKIEAHVRAGNNVVITSGLLAALQDRGIHRIAEVSVSPRKALVKTFQARAFAPLSTIDEPMLIPQVTYLTNDSWELVSALAGPNGWPLLHDADYNGGHLYVLTVPDNFADFYRLPADVLAGLRQPITVDLDVMLDAPGQVSLFLYDNDTVIVESFLDDAVTAGLVTGENIGNLRDLQSGAALDHDVIPASGGFGSPRLPPRHRFAFTLKPHSFRVFRYARAPE